MHLLSRILFYLIALWCVATGVNSLTISSADDLPWIADALAGSNVDAFNPILAIWAHWIGLFLITTSIALIIILTRLPANRSSVLVAGVLSIGTVSAQSFSVLSLGAYGPVSYALYCTPAVAIIATILGIISVEDASDS